MSELQQIIPRPGEIRPDKPYRTPDRRWEEVCDEVYGDHALPENLRFDHDAQWDRRFWSLQNVHDQVATVLPLQGKVGRRTVGFWTFVALAMVVSEMAWFQFRIR